MYTFYVEYIRLKQPNDYITLCPIFHASKLLPLDSLCLNLSPEDKIMRCFFVNIMNHCIINPRKLNKISHLAAESITML